MNTDPLLLILSHDERYQNLDELYQRLGRTLGPDARFHVQTRFLKQGLPDGDCRVLVVDLHSVAPERLAFQRLVKELRGRPHPYPVAAFGFSLWDDQFEDLRAAGIKYFRHGLDQEVFAWIAEQLSDGPPRAEGESR